MSDEPENPESVAEIIDPIPEPTLTADDLDLTDAEKRAVLGLAQTELDSAQERLTREESGYLQTLAALQAHTASPPPRNADALTKQEYAIDKKRLVGNALYLEANVESIRLYITRIEAGETTTVPPTG